MVQADPSLIGQTKEVWLVADDEVDQFAKGAIDRDAGRGRPPAERPGAGLPRQAQGDGRLETRFNRIFFTTGDSREPELAGIYGALWGSAYLMLVTLVLCVPTGIAAALYLEEFAPKNRLTDLIEVNVNNLAAVPSIVFGLLGPRRVPQHLRPAALLAAGRRHDPGAAGAADDRGRHPRRPARGAALDPPGGARHRRLQAADHDPPRPAAGPARHPDRHHHRHGARAGRDRTLADDRHEGVHRRRADLAARRRPRPCRCRSTSGPTARSARSPSGPRRRSWCCWRS